MTQVLTEVETTHAGHAAELMQGLDLSAQDGVVIVSGDGLIYEVINGLMKRPDGREALQAVPIGVVPAGSGNALAKQLTYSAGEPFDPVSAALLITRAGVKPVDLAAVAHAGGQTTWSFLALLYGLPADIDLESEACRCFGSARFDIYAALRMVALRTYTGTLRHRLGPDEPWTTVTGDFLMVWGTNVAWGSHDIHLAPTAELASGSWQLLYIQRASKCALIDAFLSKLGAGRANECEFVTEVTCSEFELDPTPRTADNPGHIDVDGEEVAFGKVSVQVHQGLARLFA